MPKRLCLILLLSFSCAVCPAQDNDPDLDNMVQELRNLSILRIDDDSETMIARQREKIELAKRILDHEDIEEQDRVFAKVMQIQALGIQFNVMFRDKKRDSELNQEYAAVIEDGLTDSDERIVLEATTAGASFCSGLFILEPNEENAGKAASALVMLSELAPQDPLIQATRRLLLEQLWDAEKNKLVFQELSNADDKAAPIALDQIDGKTEKVEAEFLWAKHFSRFGDFVAQRRLAEMYELGKGTRINNSQAARWYSKLAQLGDRFAMVKLGDFYLAGKGFAKNPESAVDQYRTAATGGSKLAAFKLGLCYLSGAGVTQDDKQWRKWVKSAAFNASGIEVQEIYTSIDFVDAADSFQIFYESLVDQYPDDIYYLNNFAYSLLISDNNDPDRSLKLIEEAIKLAPKDFEGMGNFVDTKATALKQLKKWQEAADLFASILDDIDDKPTVLKSLIECYEHIDEKKAESYRQQLEKLSK